MRPYVNSYLLHSSIIGFSMNIFVGNLSYSTTEETLQQAFEPYGKIRSVAIIKDRETGRSRGFGFVEMPDREEAEAAIAALNGEQLEGKTLTVNEARPREKRSGGYQGKRGHGETSGRDGYRGRGERDRYRESSGRDYNRGNGNSGRRSY